MNPGGDLEESTLNSAIVWQGRLLKVCRDEVRLPDGNRAFREYICHPGAVVIVARMDNGDILCEHQYRYPLHREFIELPAGKLDDNESIEACARRELLEETGYVASRWRHVGTIHPCIGYSDEHIEVFCAEGLRLSEDGAHLDEGEFLSLHPYSLAELKSLMADGRLTDAKTLAALTLSGVF